MCENKEGWEKLFEAAGTVGSVGFFSDILEAEDKLSAIKFFVTPVVLSDMEKAYVGTQSLANNIDKYLDGREIGFHSNCGNFFNADDSIQEVIHSARHIGLLASLFFDEWIIHKPYGLVPEYIAPFEIKRSV